MNTELRKNRKNDSKNDFFKLMNNSIFRKTIENLRKHRDINLSTTKTRRNYLESEPDHYITEIFQIVQQQQKLKEKGYS